MRYELYFYRLWVKNFIDSPSSSFLLRSIPSPVLYYSSIVRRSISAAQRTT
jgi:hypothetical protein